MADVSLKQAADDKLLAAVVRRDEPAFAELLRRHHGPVYRLAWRMTSGREADDIAQETFIKLWRNPEQVKSGVALKSWLLRVAANAAIDRGRKRKTASIEEAAEVADQSEGAERRLERAASAAAVDAALAYLPDRQRMALSLVYFEGLSNAAAAEVMETTIEAIESLLARGRRALKERLSGQWPALLQGLASE